jgi:hypothetical protein
MTRSTLAFLVVGLITLPGAAMLSLLSLQGVSGVWSAMVHLTLFGWITAMILTVNYHTMPVFSGRDFPYPSLIWAHWAAWVGGISLETIGLLIGWDAGAAAGLLLQLAAALLFVTNMLLLFRRGPRRVHGPLAPPIVDQPQVDRVGTQATRGAGMSLPLALLMLLAVRLGWIGSEWVLPAEHLATLGWLMLMVVGVAYHVLPRFTGRGTRGPAWARAQMRCHLAALVMMVLSLGFGWAWAFAVGGLLMTLALGLFAWTIWPTLYVIRSQLTGAQVATVTAGQVTVQPFRMPRTRGQAEKR